METSDNVAVAATTTKILSANSGRVYASIQNTSGIMLWLGLGVAAVVGKGLRVSPGQTYEFTPETNGFVGQVNGILASGGPESLPIQEAVN